MRRNRDRIGSRYEERDMLEADTRHSIGPRDPAAGPDPPERAKRGDRSLARARRHPEGAFCGAPACRTPMGRRRGPGKGRRPRGPGALGVPVPALRVSARADGGRAAAVRHGRDGDDAFPAAHQGAGGAGVGGGAVGSGAGGRGQADRSRGADEWARKRQVDPGIWTSEQVVACGPEARLLFIGCITQADDEGRLKGSAAYLKMTIFPGDAVSVDQVEVWRQEVIAQALGA